MSHVLFNIGRRTLFDPRGKGLGVKKESTKEHFQTQNDFCFFAYPCDKALSCACTKLCFIEVLFNIRK